ncbi:MAG: hypothetical protein ACLT3Y_06140 [Ruminococcus callidus]
MHPHQPAGTPPHRHQQLEAILPVPAAIILIAISVLLTLIAGFIPSKVRQRKTLVALRSE